MTDERLQQSFWLSEFLRSDTAQRRGLDNTPNAQALANIKLVLAPGMQRVRNLLLQPVLVTSGYRSPAVNAAVGSGHTSQHLQGLAADFVCPEFGTPRRVAQCLLEHASEIRFDQLIWEGAWVHVSFTRSAPRGEVLTAHFMAGGGVAYSTGIG